MLLVASLFTAFIDTVCTEYIAVFISWRFEYRRLHRVAGKMIGEWWIGKNKEGSVHSSSGYVVGIGVQGQSQRTERTSGKMADVPAEIWAEKNVPNTNVECCHHTRLLYHTRGCINFLFIFFFFGGGVIYYLIFWRYWRNTDSIGCVSPGEGIWLGDYYLCKNIYYSLWLCQLRMF